MAKILYVSMKGKDTYNCTGTSDEIIINKAIAAAHKGGYTTVHLRAGIYTIRNPIEVFSNLTIEGDSKTKTIVKLANSIALDTKSKFYLAPADRKPAHGASTDMTPLIWSSGSTVGKPVAVSNVNICNLQINANATGNSEVSLGRGYFNCMYFVLSKNISIHDMILIDGCGDGLRAVTCDTVKFYNNTVTKMGHEACFFLRSNNCHSYNNVVKIRSNSGSRMNDCTNSSIHDNDLMAFAAHWSAGGPGIQIERQYKSAISVEVYNNRIHATYGPGIWVAMNVKAIAESGKSNVNIHDNTFYDCGINPSVLWTGGIIVDRIHNVNIQNNVFDGCFSHGVSCRGMTDGTVSAVKVKVYVRNNIIVNTLPRKFTPSGTGYGLENKFASTHTVIASNNCIYNNKSGNYNAVKSADDINVNPLFTDGDNNVYTLQAKSPCIGAGYSTSKTKVDIGISNFTSTNSVEVETTDVDTSTTSVETIDTTTDTVTTVISETTDKTIVINPICNRIKESSTTTVLKSDSFVDVGGIGTRKYRGLISFDLSSYYNLNVKSATLSLYWYYPAGKTRTNDTVVEIYRPMRYSSDIVTWEKRNEEFNWNDPGGYWCDKSNHSQGDSPFSTITFSKDEVPTNTVYDMDVTDLVQKYISGFYDNSGFLIKAKDEVDNYIAFYNSNVSADNKKMKLTIVYTE